MTERCYLCRSDVEAPSKNRLCAACEADDLKVEKDENGDVWFCCFGCGRDFTMSAPGAVSVNDDPMYPAIECGACAREPQALANAARAAKRRAKG